MVEEIKLLCNSKELVEIYNDADDSSFYVCNIVACNDEHMLMLCYDRDGHSCGYKVIRNDSVMSISYDTIYLRDQQSINVNDATDYGFPVGYWNDIDIMEVFIGMCMKHKMMTGIELLEGRTRNGYIASVNYDDDALKLEVYDFAGNYDGMCIVRVSDLKMVEIDSVELSRIVRFINSK